ncbi:hypothetical protein N7501_010440 [Penicillium viridicatum]|nr:hypothetical protein N7501_010440 [Penicillium viridicatum]
MEGSISRFLLLVFGLLSVVRAIDPFTYDNDTFILHGEPYLLRGGQIDPQHIPHELWPDRLEKARGSWDNTGNNDIAKYFRLAQEKGLNIILRPGPYVCAEHEWGGFPEWLSEIPGMVVRDNNKPFLEASKAFIDRLAEEVGDLQVTNGGPILMVQIENEYGPTEVIMSTRAMLKGGQISGVFAETDGDVYDGFAAHDKYVTDPTSLGPQLDGEYYITWLDQWASNYTHKSNVGDKEATDKITKDIKWLLNNNGSFNLFMFHGGTNWGFQNGADWADALQPITTSYDYGAPLDETGRTNEIYHAIRETIGAIIGDDKLPALPAEQPLIEIPSVKLTPSVGMFNPLPEPIEKEFPVNMEAVSQATGLILYRHIITTTVSGTMKTGDKPRDRVLVYVNKSRVGVIDGTYASPRTVDVDLKEGDVLDILVENLGRVNYGPEIVDQRKGIVGNVTVGASVLSKWAIYSLPLASPPDSTDDKMPPNPSATSSPI